MTTDVETPRIIELGDRFAVRQEIDNLGWFDLGSPAGVVAVDALEHAEKEHDVFAAIADSLGAEHVDYLFHTHTHYDHVALNDAFVRRGAQIVNHRDTPLPDEGKWFEGDRRKALLKPMPGCHTSEDAVVWVEPEKVLFVGDIFGWGLIPLTRNLRSDSEKLLLDTMGALIDFGAETVVPGHGPLCDTQTLRDYVDYYHWVKDRCQAGVEAGKSDEQIRSEIDPPEHLHHWWRFQAWKHDDTVAKVLKSVRNGWI